MPLSDPVGRVDSAPRDKKTLRRVAPLFTHGYDLHAWLVDRLNNVSRPDLAVPTLEQSRRLLESITLALQGFATHDRLILADEAAALLRLHLRLCEQKGLIDDCQYLFALEHVDTIGRQLGGWLKKLEEP